MRQTENTAIVLRYANYRDYDRMLTLLSPTRGKLEVLSRGCRRPKSPLLNASELFCPGDFQLYTKQERATLVSANLLETFYPLRGISTACRWACICSIWQRLRPSPGNPARSCSCCCCTP